MLIIPVTTNDTAKAPINKGLANIAKFNPIIALVKENINEAILTAIIAIKVFLNASKFSPTNLTPLPKAVMALAKPWPTLTPNCLSSFSLSDINCFKSPNSFLSSVKKPALTATWKLKKPSFKLDTVPDKVSASSSVSIPNSPPVPKAFLNLLIVSSTLYFAPDSNPAIAVTALSLNKSAEPIPALNDLWICWEAKAKSPPNWTAVLPVIFNNSSKDTPDSSAVFLTVANALTPCWILDNSKGVFFAKSVTCFRAFCPALAEPSKAFNCTPRFSIWIPAFTNPLIARPAPIPIKAFLKLNTEALTLFNPPLSPVKALLVLSTASRRICTRSCAM